MLSVQPVPDRFGHRGGGGEWGWGEREGRDIRDDSADWTTRNTKTRPAQMKTMPL